MAAVPMLRLPLSVGMLTSATSVVSHTLDASGKAIAWVFQAETDDPITGFYFRYTSRVGTPPTYVGTVEGVDGTTGNPNGSDLGGASPTATTFTPPASSAWDLLGQWVSFVNPFIPTRGQLFSVTLRYSSGAVDGSNRSSIAYCIQGVGTTQYSSFPYSLSLTAGTWSRLNYPLLGGVQTATTRYGNIYQSLGSKIVTTAGHRAVVKFQLPAGFCTSYQLRGLRSVCAFVGGKTITLGLWSAAGLLQSGTIDTDVDASVAADQVRDFLFADTTLAVLAPGVDYFIGFETDAGGGTIVLDAFVLSEANDRLAHPLGVAACISTWNGSAWTDDTVRLGICELLLADITASGGGGGNIIVVED